MAAILLPPPAGAVIRMYRSGGLGDCFLLAFAGLDAVPCYVLIDCGVFVGTAGAQQRMQLIAADVEIATGGRLDILVATHEHWDHLAGFSFARDVFERLHIGEVWVAWTEDMSNPLARQLRQRRQQALAALLAATQRMQAANDPRAAGLQDILAFHGGLAAGAKASTAEQMQFVQTLAPVSYCKPGQPVRTLPNAPLVQAYVLGPPENEALLKRSNPRRGQVYEQAMPPAFTVSETNLPASGFYAAALAGSTSAEAPFNKQFVLPLQDLAKTAHADFFRKHYGSKGWLGGGPEWRRIDQDWLGAAEHLALALDGDTNNTSLVLAFALPGGKVLLFPGDAQAGNWLSWADVQWQNGTDTLSGLDLLRRVAVYKVGHHGSHNATLSAQGLELMERDDLIALMPVDEKQARGKRWDMPFGPLYERLQAKTRGRLLRADTGIPTRPEGVTAGQWQRFLDQVRVDSSAENLWVELNISA
jgi:hypothetical protein